MPLSHGSQVLVFMSMSSEAPRAPRAPVPTCIPPPTLTLSLSSPLLLLHTSWSSSSSWQLSGKRPCVRVRPAWLCLERGVRGKSGEEGADRSRRCTLASDAASCCCGAFSPRSWSCTRLKFLDCGSRFCRRVTGRVGTRRGVCVWACAGICDSICDGVALPLPLSSIGTSATSAPRNPPGGVDGVWDECSELRRRCASALALALILTLLVGDWDMDTRWAKPPPLLALPGIGMAWLCWLSWFGSPNTELLLGT